MSEYSFHMRSAPGGSLRQPGSQAGSRRSWSSERDSVVTRSTSLDYQPADAWSTIEVFADARPEKQPHLTQQEEAAFRTLRAQKTTLSEAQQAAEQLLSNADVSPISRYQSEILEVLSAQNHWRNIVEFLGALVDYRITIDDDDIIESLKSLLKHSDDYVFLAAAQALVYRANVNSEATAADLPSKRKHAFEQLIALARK